MSLETAARLQTLDVMARQISTQISGARRPSELPRPSQPRIPSRDVGSRKADENIVALRRRLDEAETIARRPAGLPNPSRPGIQSSDRISRKPEEDSALKRGLAEAENLLRARTEELHGERLRSHGDEQRAQSLLSRTRTLLKETRDQLAAAQKRAEEAEEYLSALHEIIRINLDVGPTKTAALTRR